MPELAEITKSRTAAGRKGDVRPVEDLTLAGAGKLSGEQLQRNDVAAEEAATRVLRSPPTHSARR